MPLRQSSWIGFAVQVGSILLIPVALQYLTGLMKQKTSDVISAHRERQNKLEAEREAVRAAKRKKDSG